MSAVVHNICAIWTVSILLGLIALVGFIFRIYRNSGPRNKPGNHQQDNSSGIISLGPSERTDIARHLER